MGPVRYQTRHIWICKHVSVARQVADYLHGFSEFLLDPKPLKRVNTHAKKKIGKKDDSRLIIFHSSPLKNIKAFIVPIGIVEVVSIENCLDK